MLIVSVSVSHVARWISIVGHPFVMVALLVAVTSMRQSSSNAVEPVLLVFIAVVLPLAVLMFRQTHRGRWKNVDASNASERPLLFGVAVAGMAVALGWLLLNDPQSFLVQGMFVVAAFTLIAGFLTRWVKLSMHVAFAALTATTLCLLGSAVGFALIPVVPLVIWSRLALARHHVHEVVMGLMLGVIAGIALARL